MAEAPCWTLGCHTKQSPLSHNSRAYFTNHRGTTGQSQEKEGGSQLRMGRTERFHQLAHRACHGRRSSGRADAGQDIAETDADQFCCYSHNSNDHHHLLFDLISSDPSNHYLDGIRDEAQRILAEEGGHWTKAGLGRCHRADSAIRESMRVSNFIRGVWFAR